MSYMKKGDHDKKSNSDSRGAANAGIGAEAISSANGIEFVEPEDAGGEQGAPAKNHWDGSGAKPANVPASNSGTPGNGGSKGY